jgi:predicted nucleotidyltransferase
MSISPLEQSIYDTVRFFDLYDMPLTRTQIWQHLVVAKTGYDHHASLQEIVRLFETSDFLKTNLEMKWGYATLRGRGSLVAKRLRRHAIAQDKWKIVRRCAYLLSCMPFVRALAGSGSLAVDNTKHTSDLDIFVIAKEGRVWTTRLMLLAASQILGRRRVYGERSAPDMLCLNHYITDKALRISSDIQNVCMAMQYTSLVPLFSDSLVRTFQQRNVFWMNAQVRLPAGIGGPSVPHRYTISLPGWMLFMKEQVENILLEPIGDSLERFAELLQRAVISRHRTSRGRIVLAYHELAFHPDTKVPSLVQRFSLDA